MFVIYPLYTIIGKIYKYVEMNIFVNFLLFGCFLQQFYIIMEAEPKIFLNLLQFITITFTIYYIMLLYIMLPIYI